MREMRHKKSRERETSIIVCSFKEYDRWKFGDERERKKERKGQRKVDYVDYVVCLCFFLQGDYLNMSVLFWHIAKSDNCPVYRGHSSVDFKSPNFTRYQKNTAMFNWSPCI